MAFHCTLHGAADAVVLKHRAAMCHVANAALYYQIHKYRVQKSVLRHWGCLALVRGITFGGHLPLVCSMHAYALAAVVNWFLACCF